MQTWAFATSRQGLSLSSKKFWALTPREFSALRKVWLDAIERTNYMHASLQATLFNAHFQNDGLPWTAEDLLGAGNRELRQRDRLRDQIESRAFNQRIATITTTADLPDWATRENEWKETVN